MLTTRNEFSCKHPPPNRPRSYCGNATLATLLNFTGLIMKAALSVTLLLFTPTSISGNAPYGGVACSILGVLLALDILKQTSA